MRAGSGRRTEGGELAAEWGWGVGGDWDGGGLLFFCVLQYKLTADCSTYNEH